MVLAASRCAKIAPITSEDSMKTRRATRTRPIDMLASAGGMGIPMSPGSVNSALVPLRMAAKLDRLRPTTRMALEPWLVEMGLERLGERQLTLAEQQTVWKATRTPWKVEWPEWWEWKG